jgi:hypothetical protein
MDREEGKTKENTGAAQFKIKWSPVGGVGGVQIAQINAADCHGLLVY